MLRASNCALYWLSRIHKVRKSRIYFGKSALPIIDLLENILESPIVFLQDSVLGRHKLRKVSKMRSRYSKEDELTKGIFLAKAILNDECAKPVIDYGINSVSGQFDQKPRMEWTMPTSSVLYMAIATPGPLKSYTSITVTADPSAGVYTSWSLPGPGAT